MSQPQRSSAPETCALCAGTGKRSFAGGYAVSCLVCGGKGKVLVTQPATQCQQCAGSGRRNPTNACLTCAGTGWAHAVGTR